MAETFLEILIKPGIPPVDRQAIEDALEELEFDVAGGGGFVDGSASDIALYVEDVEETIPSIIAILQQMRVPRATVILQREPQEKTYVVYG
jgi:hypothetical protein